MVFIKIIVSEIVTNDYREPKTEAETAPENQTSANLRVGENGPKDMDRTVNESAQIPPIEETWEEPMSKLFEEIEEIKQPQPPKPVKLSEENDLQILAVNRLFIDDKPDQQGPECRCRHCFNEETQRSWELIENFLCTDDLPRLEFRDLQGLSDICKELDEIADEGQN